MRRSNTELGFHHLKLEETQPPVSSRQRLEQSQLGQLDLLQIGKLPKVSELTLADGLDGNIQTIEFMKKVARVRSGDPLVRKLALKIVNEYGVDSHHFVDEALAIGDFVKNNVRYVRDPEDIEYLADPVDLIKQMQNGTAQGDCDDMSLLVATLLLSIGHQPYYRAVRYENVIGNYNHIYVVVYEQNMKSPRVRVVLDCILKDRAIGSEVQHMNGDEFPV